MNEYCKEPTGKKFMMRSDSNFAVNPTDIHHQWAKNLIKPPRALTGAKGVVFNPVTQRFYTKVYDPRTKLKRSLGGFATRDEAAKAYDDYMKANYGSWVYLNGRGY